MSNEQSDHDILIEVRTGIKFMQDNYVKHCEDNAVKFSLIEKAVGAAHRRIDWLLVSGILTIIIMVVANLFNLKV